MQQRNSYSYLDMALYLSKEVKICQLGLKIWKILDTDRQIYPDESVKFEGFPEEQVTNTFLSDKPVDIKSTSGRPLILTFEDGTKFVYKDDEQHYANELSMVANILLTHFKLNTIPMILMNYSLNNEKIKNIQSMKYVEDLTEFNLEEMKKIPSFVEKLGKYIAFMLFVGDFDNFLFIGRFVDNIIFADDIDYNQMNLWGNPIINEGNVLIHNNDFLLIDIRPNSDPKYIAETHKIARCFDYKIASLVAMQMNLSESQTEELTISIRKSFFHYMLSLVKFKKLYNWARDDDNLWS